MSSPFANLESPVRRRQPKRQVKTWGIGLVIACVLAHAALAAIGTQVWKMYQKPVAKAKAR